MELTDKHIQQLPTLVFNKTAFIDIYYYCIYIYIKIIFPHLQFRDGLPLVGNRAAT